MTLSPPTRQNGNMVACNWYRDEACCDNDVLENFVENVTSMYTCGGEDHTQGCLDLLIMMECAKACSPTFSTYNSVSGPDMCDSFARNLRFQCDGEFFPGQFTGEVCDFSAQSF